jgi:3-isopropylmalate/(R)-2-methylmalate dehydratase large subunit
MRPGSTKKGAKSRLMPTIAEKVFARASGHPVKAGDLVLARVSYLVTTDTKGPLGTEEAAKIGFDQAPYPEEILLCLDHNSPCATSVAATDHTKVRAFATKFGIPLAEVGDGVCHQLALESGRVLPGSLVTVTDSHASTAGALNALGVAVGSSEMAGIAGTGQMWFRVPASRTVTLKGSLPRGVYGKDVALCLIGQMGMDGAAYECLEFRGPGVATLSIADRATVCNLMVETGSKAAVMPYDAVTHEYVNSRARVPYTPVAADADAQYVGNIDIDLSTLEPQIATPPDVNYVSPVSAVAGKPIQMAFVGSCTNGRLEDIAVSAAIMKGKHVALGVKFLVAPASRTIYRDALRLGYIETLLDAGAMILPVGCGSCIGVMGNGVPADGETVMSAANRNFKGRMENKKAEIYLGSAAAAAAAALTGRITDPRDVLPEGVL